MRNPRWILAVITFLLIGGGAIPALAELTYPPMTDSSGAQSADLSFSLDQGKTYLAIDTLHERAWRLESSGKVLEELKLRAFLRKELLATGDAFRVKMEGATANYEVSLKNKASGKRFVLTDLRVKPSGASEWGLRSMAALPEVEKRQLVYGNLSLDGAGLDTLAITSDHAPSSAQVYVWDSKNRLYHAEIPRTKETRAFWQGWDQYNGNLKMGEQELPLKITMMGYSPYLSVRGMRVERKHGKYRDEREAGKSAGHNCAIATGMLRGMLMLR